MEKTENQVGYYFKFPEDKEIKNRMQKLAKQKGLNLKSLSIIAIEQYLKKNERL